MARADQDQDVVPAIAPPPHRPDREPDSPTPSLPAPSARSSRAPSTTRPSPRQPDARVPKPAHPARQCRAAGPSAPAGAAPRRRWRRRAGRPADAAAGSGSATTPPSVQEVSEGRIRVAIWPGAIRAAWTATAASRPTVRGGACRAHPGGNTARPAFRIRGQRRIKRAMVGRLVADDVDDRRRGAASIVQIGQAVREAGPQWSKVAAGLPAMRA